MEFEDFLRFLKEKGIRIKKKWGWEGGSNNISIFGTGRYYTGEYKEIKFSCARIFSEHTPLGLKIKFFYSQSLKLGLFLKCNIGSLSPLLFNERMPVFSRKLDLKIEGLTARAVKKKIAEKIFFREDLIKSVNTLKETLKISQKKSNVFDTYNIFKQAVVAENGFLIADQYILVLISFSSEGINFETLMENLYQFWKILQESCKEIR